MRPTSRFTLLVLALLLLSCPGTERARPRNVIFILVDTLRADHLGAYGYSRETSPGFDAFATASCAS